MPRTLLLSVHVVSGVGLLGADLALVALGIQGATGAPPDEVYPAMSAVAAAVMVPLGFAALGTGLALAGVTGTGLRRGWVAAKLAITTALAVLLLGALLPGLAAAESAAGSAPAPGPPALAVGPAVSATLLTANVLLGVTKPGGRSTTGAGR